MPDVPKFTHWSSHDLTSWIEFLKFYDYAPPEILDWLAALNEDMP